MAWSSTNSVCTCALPTCWAPLPNTLLGFPAYPCPRNCWPGLRPTSSPSPCTCGLMMQMACLVGIVLTRTVTYSVANLYTAAEYSNRGHFTHRIQVRHKDQLGALQTAFNSMTESLHRLIEEQKEKERLRSELEIAHEVQAQLFPQSGCGPRTLEPYGACRPARI